MLKRPSAIAAQSNTDQFDTASDAYRSLHYSCNYKPSAVSDAAGKLMPALNHQIEADG